ncbi:hypothetical protein IJH01_02790 [Candidatus Saccharibacteria bacterium]|nr:hypothetical protein [Candidatus Saccharibacteria bacterium]
MTLKLTEEWDKIFPKSEKVDHKKPKNARKNALPLISNVTPRGYHKRSLNSNDGWAQLHQVFNHDIVSS